MNRISLDEDIARFRSFGTHRSGTSGDAATVDWLASRLQDGGYEVKRNSVPIRTLLDPEARLTVDGLTITGFPQFMPPASALEAPTSAVLRLDDGGNLAGAIAIIPKPIPFGSYWTQNEDRLIDSCVRRGARGVSYAVDTPRGEIFLFNREISAQPFPVPVVCVSRADLNILVAAAGKPCRLDLAGHMEQRTTESLLASKSGAGPTLVISTPLTGWFCCVAERGPGIALWLALAEALSNTSYPITLVGSAGHELGHLGMHQVLEAKDPLPDSTALWVHLGASIAARMPAEGSPLQAIYCTPLVGDATKAAFLADERLIHCGGASRGETAQIIAAGYLNVVGLAGAHEAFHMPSDDGSEIDHAALAQRFQQLSALIQHVML